jgi:hypothetical protein
MSVSGTTLVYRRFSDFTPQTSTALHSPGCYSSYMAGDNV